MKSLAIVIVLGLSAFSAERHRTKLATTIAQRALSVEMGRYRRTRFRQPHDSR